MLSTGNLFSYCNEMYLFNKCHLSCPEYKLYEFNVQGLVCAKDVSIIFKLQAIVVLYDYIIVGSVFIEITKTEAISYLYTYLFTNYRTSYTRCNGSSGVNVTS